MAVKFAGTLAKLAQSSAAPTEEDFKNHYVIPEHQLPPIDKILEHNSGFDVTIGKKQSGVGYDFKMSPSVVQEPAPAPKVSSELLGTTGTEDMVSEYIELQKKLDAIDTKPILKRQEEIKKALQSIANEADPDEAQIFVGNEPGEIMTFSAQSNVQSIADPVKLLEHLLDKGFSSEQLSTVLSIGMAKLQKLLSGNELAPFLTETKGSRSLRAVKYPKE